MENLYDKISFFYYYICIGIKLHGFMYVIRAICAEIFLFLYIDMSNRGMRKPPFIALK